MESSRRVESCLGPTGCGQDGPGALRTRLSSWFPVGRCWCYSGLGGPRGLCPTLDQCRRLQELGTGGRQGRCGSRPRAPQARGADTLTLSLQRSTLESPPHRPWTPQGERASLREQNKALSLLSSEAGPRSPFRSCQLPAGDVFSHPLLLLWVCQALQRWAVGGSALREKGPREWTSELESAGQRLQSAWLVFGEASSLCRLEGAGPAAFAGADRALP